MTAQTVFSDNNRADILKNYYAVADSRPFNPNDLRQFLSQDLVDHNAHDPDANAIESTLSTFTSLAEGAPDSAHDLQVVQPAGEDQVVVYWVYQGTHTGDMLGMPATDKAFKISGMELYKITDNKISDIWHVEDIAGLMSQLELTGQ